MSRVVTALDSNISWIASESVDFYTSPYLWQWSELTVQWTTFGQWGSKMSQAIDLDHVEREFKAAAIDRVSQAAAAMNRGAPEWTTMLGEAFTKENNLVGSSFPGWLGAC